MDFFRGAFGTTMTTFITQHRISHAQRLHAPVSVVGSDAGVAIHEVAVDISQAVIVDRHLQDRSH